MRTTNCIPWHCKQCIHSIRQEEHPVLLQKWLLQRLGMRRPPCQSCFVQIILLSTMKKNRGGSQFGAKNWFTITQACPKIGNQLVGCQIGSPTLQYLRMFCDVLTCQMLTCEFSSINQPCPQFGAMTIYTGKD